jgi:hypothetical protein
MSSRQLDSPRAIGTGDVANKLARDNAFVRRSSPDFRFSGSLAGTGSLATGNFLVGYFPLVARSAACPHVDCRAPVLQSVRFFNPSAFYSEFFSHFGPHDFMGLPLQGAWWIPVYYAVVMLVRNIGGEEL